MKVQGNGVTRYLVENTDAAEGYAWQSSSASIKITPGDKLYYAGRGDVSASKSGEVTSIPFPNCDDITALTKIEVTLTSNTIATSYRPTRYLPSVYFFGAWISYDDQFTSLMDTIAINNNARGAASDVNLIVSGLTDVALEKYFISNSLLDGSGSLLGAVHTSAFEGQDYISLLSRDYALSIAAPRLKAEGVFYGQERTDLPLFMSMGGLRYVIETWDWNLITGGVDFSALTLPAATITVTSETIVTGDNLGHGSSSGSGGSGGSSSSGAGYVAPGTGVPALTEAYIGTTRVQPSPTEDQDLTGIGNATLSGKLNLPQGAYLEVVNVGTTASPVYAIHTNIGLYSDSFISAFGASDTGGGGGGIDLSAMWANLQVNESGTTGYNLQINPGHLTTALGTYVNAITTTGSGNAITAVSKDGSTLTFTKGSTFALASRTVTGTGYLTGGGALSANRTIDIASTYKGYIDEGHTAYGWGDHAEAGYLTGITSSMVTTALGFTPANSTALANYLPLTGGAMANTNKVTNLNADLLDGLNSTDFAQKFSYILGTASSVDISFTGMYHAIIIARNTNSSEPLILIGGGYGVTSIRNRFKQISTTSSPFHWRYHSREGVQIINNGLSNASVSVLVTIGTAPTFTAATFDIETDFEDYALETVNGAASKYLPLSGGTLTGDLTAPKFIKTGGTSSQFLKADGSVDSSAYLTTTTAADTYLPLTGGTMTGGLVLSNSVYLSVKDTGGTARAGVFLNSSNGFYVGYGTSAAGYNAYLGGNQIYFQYGTGHATGMLLDSSGNVGIGTTTPANKLHVSGAGRFDGNANIWSTISGAQINFNKLSTYTTGYNQGIRFRIADSSNTEISSKYLLGVYSTSAYQYMYLGGTYTDATVRITDTGVGIMKGNASPSYALDVGGVIHSTVGIYSDGYVSAYGQSTTSDARLKKDFRDTTLTVDDIAHAPAITFLWKDREGKRQAGSLAQYWETVLPEVVSDIEGKKGLDYGAAALVSAITIARDVNDHEKRIRELERENRELKRRLGYAN